jgi:hypothetical protein
MLKGFEMDALHIIGLIFVTLNFSISIYWIFDSENIKERYLAFFATMGWLCAGLYLTSIMTKG